MLAAFREQLSTLWFQAVSAMFLLIVGAVGRYLITLIKLKIEAAWENRQHRRDAEEARLAAVEDMQKVLPTLKLIAAEFRPNGGSTFRDKLDSAAKDAKEAKDLSAAQVEQGKQQQKQIDAIKIDVGHIREEMFDVDKRMARFIVHEARNDLNTSKLAHEAEQLLAEEDLETN